MAVGVVIPSVTSFPSVLTITNLARSMVRDDMAGATNTPGEGQILVNNITTSVTMANLFNSAVRSISRKLRLVSAPMLIADNYIILNIPPLWGPTGFQVADPSVQVRVTFNGYFDGTQWHASYALPHGVYQVIRCWERENSSNDTFADMGEPSNGLAGVYQTNGWGRWEWRQDSVVLPGSLDYRDLRLRYWMILDAYMVANANPATTYLPIMDCEEAMATEIARLYSIRQGGMMTPIAKETADNEVALLTDETVHQKQGQNYETKAYGSECPPVLNFGQ